VAAIQLFPWGAVRRLARRGGRLQGLCVTVEMGCGVLSGKLGVPSVSVKVPGHMCLSPRQPVH